MTGPFSTLLRKLQSSCRQVYNDYVSNMQSDCDKSNPKKFWGFIKSKRNESSGIAPLKHNEEIHSDSKMKSNILNEQFTCAFSKENTDNIPLMPKSNHETIPDIKISHKGVYKLLREINPHKATGPDGIPGKLLKQCSDEITPILTKIFNSSITQGQAPKRWKEALITPIFKKGDRSKASNYRPVSLTCICSKIFEHIMHSNIISHLESNNVLSDHQHGFRKHRSCESQLINTIQDLSNSLNNSDQVDCVLLDFFKAFDKVPHQRLLRKCEFYGVRGNNLKWISSFLQGRTQQVLVEGETSEMSNVTSGVPQGTVLGPLLFLLYINDLPESVSSKSRLFADDCLLYRTIKCREDTSQLQQDLNNLQEWENTWQMSFNPDKCEVLRVCNKRNPIVVNYRIHETNLLSQKTVKYLGLNINQHLSWNDHIDIITKKANTLTSLLNRNIRDCPNNIKAKCYKTLIRPIVEYASSVWDPITKKNIQKLEMVQRRAARFVMGNYKTTDSVTNMLQQLEWQTLKTRREQAKLAMLYRTHHQLITISTVNLLPATTRTKTRGHSHRFTIPRSNVKCHEQSFFPSTIRLWNTLPPVIVNANDLDTFKSRLSYFYNDFENVKYQNQICDNAPEVICK